MLTKIKKYTQTKNPKIYKCKRIMHTQKIAHANEIPRYQ